VQTDYGAKVFLMTGSITVGDWRVEGVEEFFLKIVLILIYVFSQNVELCCF